MAICLTACGGPAWIRGTSRSQYYYQGVGSGKDAYEAERRALVDLTTEIEGRKVVVTTEVYQSESGRAENGRLSSDETSTFEQWISEKYSATIPAGAHVAERHFGGDRYWAYAIAEKNGVHNQIESLYQNKMRRVHRRAYVPGLAQFEKGETRKAWTIVAAEAIGVIGWGALHLIASDLRDRRDRARKVATYDYYDRWANRTTWGGLSGGVIAVGVFGYSVLDGVLSVPPRHQLMLAKEREAVWAIVAIR
jgi:hypothetical protein